MRGGVAGKEKNDLPSIGTVDHRQRPYFVCRTDEAGNMTLFGAEFVAKGRAYGKGRSR